MILANGCNITKSENFKGVWILSVPTDIYIYIDLYINKTFFYIVPFYIWAPAPKELSARPWSSVKEKYFQSEYTVTHKETKDFTPVPFRKVINHIHKCTVCSAQYRFIDPWTAPWLISFFVVVFFIKKSSGPWGGRQAVGFNWKSIFFASCSLLYVLT